MEQCREMSKLNAGVTLQHHSEGADTTIELLQNVTGCELVYSCEVLWW